MTMLRRIGILIVALLALSSGPEAWAQTKVGPEFKINTSPILSGEHIFHSLAPLGNGGFVVIWHSQSTDYPFAAEYGQRFGTTGARLGSEFRIPPPPIRNYGIGALGNLSTGGFVVAYTSPSDGCGASKVCVQRYSQAGVPVGSRANPNNKGSARMAITGLTNGSFVVVWPGRDGVGTQIDAELYSASGMPLKNFRVDTSNSSGKWEGVVARLSGGGFVVTWTSQNQDGSSWAIYGQRFNASGNRLGGEFRVNSYQNTNQNILSFVAGLTDGGFIVTWSAYSETTSFSNVYAQRYDAAGRRVGNCFRVNTGNEQYNIYSAVAGLSDGGFVVTWEANSKVYGRLYNAAGNPVGNDFRVDTTGVGLLGGPAVRLVKGGFVVIWRSNSAIYGQRFSQ